MKVIDGQFAPASAPPRLAWLLPIALLCLAAAHLFGGWRVQEELQDLRRSYRYDGRSAEPPAFPGIEPHEPRYGNSARQFVAERFAIWPAVLAELERSRAAGVTVVSVEWNSTDRAARVEIEAVDYAKALAFVNVLAAGGNETADAIRWTLLRAAATPEGQGVRASIAASSSDSRVER